jgi:hypothetical protein
MELKINFLAILVAVVVNFIIGFLWYGPIFGKLWGKEMGFAADHKPDPKLFIRGMVFMIIGNFLFAWVFAHNIAAWTYVPGMKELSAFSNAMNAGIFTWIGFYLPGHLGSTVWDKKSWTLFSINASYDLVAVVSVALILCYWV